MTEYEYENEDFEALMQEPPGGENHGTLNGSSLNPRDWVHHDFRMRGGFGIMGEGEGGTKGNRHVLHENAYVDTEILNPMLEEELGFSLEEIQAIYAHRGRLPSEGKARRAKMDAKFLALKTAGANMFRLAEVVGVKQRTMNRATDRAKSAYFEDMQALQSERKALRDNA